MSLEPNSPQPSSEFYFSLVRGGPFSKLRVAIGLVPEGGLGLARRAIALVALAWLPVVVGALIAGQALNGQGSDPLLRHFGIHSRLLLAIPLLIFAEALMEKLIPPVISHFVTSGIVAGSAIPPFQAALEAARRLRDSVWGRVFVLAAIGAMILVGTANKNHVDEMAWAVTRTNDGTGIGFAGWWFLFVSRPIFGGLLAIWLWRLLVMWTLVWRISKLELRLVASHPDGVGGLAFVEGTTVAMVPIVLAISVVMAGRWGHEVLYHGVHVDSLKPLVAVFVVTVVLFFNGPLLLFSRNLRAFKRKSLREYSALVGNHGRLVYQRWIRNEDVGAPDVLNAPELGPVVDISSIYESVAKLRFAPIGKQSLLPVALAALLPMLPVFAIEVPIKEMLKALAGALL